MLFYYQHSARGIDRVRIIEYNSRYPEHVRVQEESEKYTKTVHISALWPAWHDEKQADEIAEEQHADMWDFDAVVDEIATADDMSIGRGILLSRLWNEKYEDCWGGMLEWADSLEQHLPRWISKFGNKDHQWLSWKFRGMLLDVEGAVKDIEEIITHDEAWLDYWETRIQDEQYLDQQWLRFGG